MKNGPEMAQRSRASKTHQDYWKSRITKRTYRDGAGDEVEIPEWHVRLALLKRREWFNLGTPNQAAASIKARDIWIYLQANGWEATLAKYKPKAVEEAPNGCTLGEFAAATRAKSALRPRTVELYLSKLRTLMAGIHGKQDDAKRHGKTGRRAWLKAMDALPLNSLTPDAIAKWRVAYVARAGKDPVKQRSAEISAGSYMRAARALLSANATASLGLTLPNPFAGVKIKQPGPRRHRTEVPPELLWADGITELKDSDPQAFLGLTLLLPVGLRRREADTLLISQVHPAAGVVRVERTQFFAPKTDESARDVDISPDVAAILSGFIAEAQGLFLMAGSTPRQSNKWVHYRADKTWNRLIAWLKLKGVTSRNALHHLRKESGSLVADQFGIEAARAHLGHRDVSTTSAIYVSKRKRFAVSLTQPPL